MFQILSQEDSKNSRARAGILKTEHGKLNTPFFMPVATKGAAKLLTSEELIECGVECIISNALLLYMKPGLEIINSSGGLHKFIGWEKGIFTDSGGFQLLSPQFLIETNNKGAWFRNPFNKSKEFFSPEKCMEVQNSLGADVAMALDDVLHFGKTKEEFSESLKKTMHWMERCKSAHSNDKQLVFGISQGGLFPDLRERSIKQLLELDFDGIALGGLCIGEEREKRDKIVKLCKTKLPQDKPVYLMGVGSGQDLINSIANGVDVFDSCFPTRTARHGMAITSKGNLQIDKGKFSNDLSPIDENCDCFVCKKYSRAFLHHLVSTKEENGGKYLSLHNVYFIQQLVRESREAIVKGYFGEFRKEFLGNFNGKAN